MSISLLAVRLTALKERRHGTCFGNWFAFGAMAKAYEAVVYGIAAPLL